jgi:predicted DNA binding protein
LLDLTKDEFADLQRKDEETFFDGKEELEDAEKSEAEEKEDSFKERQESEDKLTDQEIEVILKNIKTFSCNF